MDHEQYLISIYETRRANLREQAATIGGISAMAAKIGFSQSWVSQLFRLPFSEKVARRIEEGLGIKFGTLDKPVAGRKKV
jgi:hypothetical protein